jgi:TolB-like protein
MTLFVELKRRNVFRVGAAYAVIAWLLLQVVDVIAPILELPEWAPKIILLIITIGFVPALIFAWAFEITPEGVKREKDIDRTQSVTRQTGQKLNRVIIGVLVLIILMMAAERFWPSINRGGSGNLVEAPVLAPGQVPIDDASTPAPGKSVAALPFVNRSSGMENTRFFSDGIHDDLLTRLSKIHDLRVISRTSVMAYRDTVKNMREIGEELGVENLLEGSVQQMGDRVRINVQLINAPSDTHLWANTYDRKITAENIFNIQAEIARAIALALEATLTPTEDEILNQEPTRNLDAYRALLKSRELDLRGNLLSLEKASEHAQQAIDLDPAYVDAHLALARILTRMIAAGSSTDNEVRGRINSAIETARAIQPDSGPVYSALGYYQYISGKPGWEDSFEKAMALEPGNSDTMYAYGYSLQSSGHPQKALPLLELAIAKDPLSQPIWFAMGRNLIVLAEYERARHAFSRIREIDPSSTLGYGPVSGTYLAEGKLDMALYWSGQAMHIDAQDLEHAGWMIFLNDCLEDYNAAQKWSDWLDSRVTKQPQPMAMQARHHYLTGNFELANQISNRAIKMDLPDRWGSDAIFMRIKRDQALADGDPESGIDVFRGRHPELFESSPEMSAGNLQQAVDLAQLLMLTGRTGESERLLDAAIEFYDKPWAASGSKRYWLPPVKAEALAVKGENTAALAELRRIIDTGWRVHWRWETSLNFNFNGIRKTPEFRSMVEELAAQMAEQRLNAQAMTNMGQIPLPLDIDLKPRRLEFN